MDQQLEVFVMVAEKQNFTRAAEALHMTQPAVSQYIRMLEENMGQRLLERTNKYVYLNKAGEIVYHHAKEIIALYDRMENLVEDLTDNPVGPLSIGASYTFGEYVLPEILAKMKRNYPEIKPIVSIGNTKEIADLVKRHQLDIGIVEGDVIQDKELTMEDVATDFMYIVASPQHPLNLRKDKIEAKSLEQVDWFLREKGSGTRAAIDKVFQQLEIQPKSTLTLGSTQPIKSLVEKGMGISLMSEWAIQKELRDGDVTILPVEGLPLSRKFSTLIATPFRSKALQVFIKLLQE
ncbi:LysR family transcriptional regulator [Pseudogracilibacillus sp. ICA-222130]|uniref:LysR family transcriptional regulator n=1 Tax=Pseudogracilibacillus sp. ICA-222130 TaxID=3134655 RepID=UPI0030C0BB6A